MTIKEYITNRIENCTNLEIKKVFENLLWEFEDKPTSKYYSYPKTNDVQDNIDGVCIYILAHKEDDSNTYNIRNGYKSSIDEDIIENNGDIYKKIGVYQSYNFYKLKDTYYFRMKGSNVLSEINENNYEKFKEFIRYIENGDKNEK